MTRFLLGVAYGFGLGMAARGLLDYAEAVAGKKPAPKPVLVKVDGAHIEAALRRERRRKGER